MEPGNLEEWETEGVSLKYPNGVKLRGEVHVKEVFAEKTEVELREY